MNWATLRAIADEAAKWKPEDQYKDLALTLVVQGATPDDELTLKWRQEWARWVSGLSTPDFVEAAFSMFDDTNPVDTPDDVATWLDGDSASWLEGEAARPRIQMLCDELQDAVRVRSAGPQVIGELVLEAMRKDRHNIVQVFHAKLMRLAEEREVEA